MPIIFHVLFMSNFYVCLTYLCIFNLRFLQSCVLEFEALFIGICYRPFGRDFCAIFGVFEDYLYFILRHYKFLSFIASVVGNCMEREGEGETDSEKPK